MTRLRWLAPLAFLAAACSEGGSTTGPSDEPGAFTADRSTYAVHEVALLTLNGPAPAAGVVVEGMLGTTPVMLARSSDSSVVFLAPPVTGTHTLAFTAAGRAYSGAITVLAVQPVANPIEYLESVASDAAVQIDAAEQEILLEGMTEENALALEFLQIARDSLASFESSLAQLTPDDAQQAANALSVNLARMQEASGRLAAAGIASAVVQIAIPAHCAEKTTALERYKCTWGAFINAMAGATIGFGGGILSLSLGPWGIPVAAGLGVYGAIDFARAVRLGWELVKIHGMVAAEISKSMGKAVWDATGAPVWEAGTEYFRTQVYNADGFALAGGMAAPASMTSFTDGGTVSFSFAPQLRPVQAGDRALGVSWLNTALGHVQRYNEAVARLGTRFQMSFAEPETTYSPDVPYEQISIEVIDNPQVRVSSVEGSGTRVDVTFETDATTEQEFTYDVVYNSGVYPEMRVRFEAKLRMPVYALGSYADSTLLGDTITMYGRTRNFYRLMHDDGTLLGDQHIDIGTGTSTVLPPHVFYMLNGNGDDIVYMEGWLTDPAIVADTFDIKGIINYTENALNLTVIMRDSAGVYGTSLLGEWTRRGYRRSGDGEVLDEMEGLRYNADGTVTVLYTTSYFSNAPPETDYTPRSFSWRIGVELVDGRPVHHLRHDGDSWFATFPVTYPVESFGYGGYEARSVYTRD